MTIFELGALGEFVGAITVVLTLLYLAIQVRQNTRAMKAQIHQQLSSGYIGIVGVVAENSKAFSAGLVATDDEFFALSEEELTIFMGTMFGFFKHYEHMYVQYEQSLLDEQTWLAWSEHIRMYYHQPGVLRWWQMRRTTFIPSFREFLESSSKPDMPSLVDLMNTSG